MTLPHPLPPRLRRLAAALLLLLGSLAATPAATEITAVLWITNTPAGLTSNLTVNAGTAITRYWTNDATATNTLLIQTTNTTTASRTNLMVHLAASPLYTVGAGSPQVSVSYNATNTSAINLTAPDNTNLTVTANGTWARVTYFTNTYVESSPILNRTNAMSHRERTNAANAIANFLSLAVTNPVSAAASALTNFVNLYAAQTLSNKSLHGSVLDGARDTNSLGNHGTNLQFTVFVLTGPGGIGGLTNLAGNLGAGALTNGSFYSNVLAWARMTNVFGLHGSLFLLKDGGLTNVALDRVFATNLVNYGDSFRSEGPGVNSFQAGSNAWAAADFSTAVGNGPVTSNTAATAVGYAVTNLSDYSVALGALLRLQGTGAGYNTVIGATTTLTGLQSIVIGSGSTIKDVEQSLIIGNAITATRVTNTVLLSRQIGFADANRAIGIGMFIDELTHDTVVIGYGAGSVYSNSAAIGPRDSSGNAVAATTYNQLRMGTTRQVLSVPGFIQGTLSNLVTASGQTNVLNGSLATPRGTVSTVANGANTIDMGTNVVLDLTGSPTTTWSVDGIKLGTAAPYDGQRLWLKNTTGYDSTFAHNSGLEPTAAYRISTATSTNVIFTNGATAALVYFQSSARWILWSVWDGRVPGVEATATNAVAHTGGSATNLSVYNATNSGQWTWSTNLASYTGTNCFVDFGTNIYQALTLTNDVLFLTTNRTDNAGIRNVVLTLDSTGAANRTLHFSSSWKWLSVTPPFVMPSNKVAVLSLRLHGTAETGVVATYVCQP